MPEVLPWNLEPMASLLARAQGGRLAHALLIAGTRGLGKSHFARELGKRLLCEGSGAAPLATCACAACVFSESGCHPDLRVLDPEEGKNEIKVEQVRDLTQFLGLTSQRGRGKVAIIDPAERMNANASNALLKTLEEPTDDTFILLVTSAAGGLSATIRSRCQSLFLHPPAGDEAREWLGPERHEVKEWMLRVSGGAPLRLAELVEREYVKQRREFFAQFRGLADGRLDVTLICEGLDVDETRLRLGLLVGWLQDMVRIRFVSNGEYVKNIDLGTELAKIADRVAAVELFRRLERAETALRLCATSVNRQLLLEDALLSWCALPEFR